MLCIMGGKTVSIRFYCDLELEVSQEGKVELLEPISLTKEFKAKQNTQTSFLTLKNTGYCAIL